MGKQAMMITEKQVLTDPQLPPTTELLQEVMRDNYANFDRLLTLFDKQGITTKMAKVGSERLNAKRKPYCGYRYGEIASNYLFSLPRKRDVALTNYPLM